MKNRQPSLLVFPAFQLGTLVDFRNQPFLLSGDHAFTHRVLVGLTGQGKSKLIATQFVQMFNAGIACSVIDPHAELIDDILNILIHSKWFDQRNKTAYSKLWYIRFQDEKNRFVPFNWLEQPFDHDQIALKFVEAIKRAFPEVENGAPNLQNILLSAVSVILACNLQLTDLMPLLTNAAWREQLLGSGRVKNPLVLSFFADRFNHYDKSLSESTLRRIFLLNFSPVLRCSLGAADNLIDFTRIIDEGISVLFDLGGLEEQTQRLLGVLLTVGYEQAMIARATKNAKITKNMLFIDEWHQFLSQNSKSLTNMLDLTRKFGLSLTLSSQHFGQTAAIRSSIQNCLLLAFCLGQLDAKATAPFFISVRAYPAPASGFEQAFSWLFGDGQELDANQQKAAYWELKLKNLPRQHCLVHMDGYSVELQTISVPPLSNKRELQRVKEEYARRLKRPGKEEDLSLGGRPPASTQTGTTTPTTRQQENKVQSAGTPPQHPSDGGTDDEEEYHRWTEL